MSMRRFHVPAHGPACPGSKGARRRAGLVATSVLALALTACSSTQELAELEPSEPADKLYNEGLAALNTGSMGDAVEKFEEVDKQHPYSEFAKRSLVLSAFANYRRGNYDEAITSAQRYVAMHPGSEDAAYAQYIIGQSYFNQIVEVTRDQERAEKALNAYGEVVRLYPDSEYALDAQRKIEIAKDQIAGKEMQVGRYYLERRNYVGAINRFRDVVEKHQTTRHVEEALYRLTEAYLSLGITNEAQTAAAVLGHNYPDSRWYQNAFALLQTGGLSPQENEGSWISRAIRGVVG